MLNITWQAPPDWKSTGTTKTRFEGAAILFSTSWTHLDARWTTQRWLQSFTSHWNTIWRMAGRLFRKNTYCVFHSLDGFRKQHCFRKENRYSAVCIVQKSIQVWCPVSFQRRAVGRRSRCNFVCRQSSLRCHAPVRFRRGQKKTSEHR